MAHSLLLSGWGAVLTAPAVVPARTRKEIHDLIPPTQATQATQHDSVPFLLVRAPAPMKPNVIEDDAETTEIPSSKSVPPHSPPVPVSTTEHELPSVIVDAGVLDAAELQRATDVDGLLTTAETLELPISIDVDASLDAGMETRKQILRPGAVRARTARKLGFAIAAVAALTAAGGTFAGLRVYHVSGFSLSAAPHLVR